MQPYHSAYEHLLDELERVSLLTERAIRRQWAMPGLRARLEPALSRVLGIEDIEPQDAQWALVERLGLQIADLEEAIHRRSAATRVQGTALPLVELRQRFELDDFQHDILLLALAPEVDARFATLFGTLLRDRGRAWIDVCLVSDVLCENAWQRGRLFSDLAEHGPIRRNHLVELLPAEIGAPSSLLYRPLRINRALLEHALGNEARPALHETLHAPPGPAQSELEYAEPVLAMLPQMKRLLDFVPGLPVLTLSGRPGTGKRSLIRSVAGESGLGVLELRASSLPTDPLSLDIRIKEWLLRAALSRSVCYVTDLDEFVPDESGPRDPRYAVLARLIDQFAGPVALGSTRSLKHLSLGKRPLLHVNLGAPAANLLERIWRRELRRASLWLPPEQIRELSMTFHLSGGIVREAVQLAAQASAAAAGPHTVSFDLMERTVGTIVGTRLGKLARRVESLGAWDDLIATDDMTTAIQGLVSRYRHREKVLNQWGFGRRLRIDSGISALFYGPPGTGKSMTAGIIAHELGFQMYQVDLAMVMSKWLGETERNLAQIFDEAESGKVLLLFDEADSLFSKRSSTVDTAQSQALSQRVNFILTRLEHFRGFAVLTSNRDQAIDEAFERRLSARIYFPTPDEAHREQIWRRMLEGVPGLPDSLYGTLAGVELAGGHIRNVCANAAFAAANQGTEIGERQLLTCLVRQIEDAGRIAPTWLLHAPHA